MSISSKYSYVGVAFVIFTFGVWAVPKIIAHFQEPDFAIINSAPRFKLTNQNGNTITERFYKDKVYLVEFFFTSCPNICITMNRNMKQIQQKFLGNPNFGIASISIDPKRDVPEKLLEYAQRHQAGPNWNFLTGEESYIYDIANRGFNLYATKVEGGENGFEHSGLFALIDKNGNIRSRRDKNGNPIIYYDGLSDRDIRMLIEDIQKLLR